MKKIILFDKSVLFIQDKQLAKLEKAMSQPGGFWLNHVSGRDYLAKGAIARITNGGPDAPREIEPTRTLEAPKEQVTKDSKGYQAFLKAKEKFVKKKEANK